jgi:hypothetical protein
VWPAVGGVNEESGVAGAGTPDFISGNCHSEWGPMRGRHGGEDVCRAPEESSRGGSVPGRAPPQPRLRDPAPRSVRPPLFRAIAGIARDGGPCRGAGFYGGSARCAARGRAQAGGGAAGRAGPRGRVDSSGAHQAAAWRWMPCVGSARNDTPWKPRDDVVRRMWCGGRAREGCIAVREGGLCAFVAAGFQPAGPMANRRVRDARPEGRDGAARARSAAGRVDAWRGGGPARLGTVVSCLTARAARPGAQRRDTPKPAVQAVAVSQITDDGHESGR